MRIVALRHSFWREIYLAGRLALEPYINELMPVYVKKLSVLLLLITIPLVNEQVVEGLGALWAGEQFYFLLTQGCNNGSQVIDILLLYETIPAQSGQVIYK